MCSTPIDFLDMRSDLKRDSEMETEQRYDLAHGENEVAANQEGSGEANPPEPRVEQVAPRPDPREFREEAATMEGGALNRDTDDRESVTRT
jgi:hypothetical protein